MTRRSSHLASAAASTGSEDAVGDSSPVEGVSSEDGGGAVRDHRNMGENGRYAKNQTEYGCSTCLVKYN